MYSVFQYYLDVSSSFLVLKALSWTLNAAFERGIGQKESALIAIYLSIPHTLYMAYSYKKIFCPKCKVKSIQNYTYTCALPDEVAMSLASSISAIDRVISTIHAPSGIGECM